MCTEYSTVMQSKLRARGWECYGPDDLPVPKVEQDKFDVITCFNVLDRGTSICLPSIVANYEQPISP